MSSWSDAAPERHELPYGLRRRLMAVVFGIILLLSLLNVFNLIWVGMYYRDMSTRVSRQSEVNALIATIRRRGSAIYNYSRSANPDYLAEAYDESDVDLDNLASGFSGTVAQQSLYRLRDIRSMMETLDEKTDNLIKEQRAGLGTIYVQDLGDEILRLSGYIIVELQSLSELSMDDLSRFYRGFSHRMQRTITLSFGLLIVTAVAALALARYFVLSVSRPIHRLAIQMVNFGKGDMDSRIGDIGGRDEIAVLGHSFDEMAERIRDYISRLKTQADLERRLGEQELAREEAERLLKEAELSRLHAQINPHFLFNTLNILGSLSLVENAPRTGEVVAELSELLRYSLRSGAGLVTLKDELDILRSYMTIQRYRFVGKIRWAEDIDENLLDTRIPGMILQPLVENAVKHGLEPIERTGTVTLKVERVGSGIHVSIRDDGVGIGDAALYLLDSEAGSSDSLGLRNVKRRLIIHYGVDVLTIRRPQSGGTECLISIPVDD